MELILLIAIAILVTVLLVLALTKGNNQTQAEQLQIALRQQMQENREELNRSIRELRMEMTQTLNQNMQQLQDVLHKNMMTTGELQRQKFDMMARQQETLIKSTEKRLDDMRLMVEEKLQKTLNETEEQLSASRRTYNAAVTDYNNSVMTFPSNIIANLFSFTKKEVFAIPEEEKVNPDVKKLFRS